MASIYCSTSEIEQPLTGATVHDWAALQLDSQTLESRLGEKAKLVFEYNKLQAKLQQAREGFDIEYSRRIYAHPDYQEFQRSKTAEEEGLKKLCKDLKEQFKTRSPEEVLPQYNRDVNLACDRIDIIDAELGKIYETTRDQMFKELTELQTKTVFASVVWVQAQEVKQAEVITPAPDAGLADSFGEPIKGASWVLEGLPLEIFDTADLISLQQRLTAVLAKREEKEQVSIQVETSAEQTSVTNPVNCGWISDVRAKLSKLKSLISW